MSGAGGVLDPTITEKGTVTIEKSLCLAYWILPDYELVAHRGLALNFLLPMETLMLGRYAAPQIVFCPARSLWASTKTTL